MGEERLLGLLEGKIANGGVAEGGGGEEGVVQVRFPLSRTQLETRRAEEN